jgi:hypothetical protein
MANVAIFNFTGVYVDGQWKNIHYYNSIISAFKKRKHNVLNFITNEIILDPWNGLNISISPYVEEEVETVLKKFKPDLIICFNNSKINIVDKFDCPIVIWAADTARYFSDKDSIKKNVDRYHIIYSSKNGEENFINLFNAKKKNLIYIENATSIKPKKIKKIHDISFIGSLYDPDLYFNLKKSDDNYIDYISARERKKILLNLIGYDLKIYTNKIPLAYHSLKTCNKISDKIVFDTDEVEKVMNQSLISLNHSHYQAKNIDYSWRVHDILASSSLLITEESNLLSERFGKNIKKQFYSSAYDVRKKCDYFLKNKNARLDLIAEQNEIIDKFYRWEDRIKKIEDIFGLKNEMNKKISTIRFRCKSNLKPTLRISFFLILIEFNLKIKKVYNTNNFGRIFFLFLRKNFFAIYKFLLQIKYFSNLKNKGLK